MGIRRLRRDAGLTTIREEAVIPWMACKLDPRAQDLAPLLQTHVSGWDGVLKQQLTFWDAQTLADLTVHAVDEQLDVHVKEFAHVLRAKAPERMDYYFKSNPTQVIKPVLGSETETVRNWIPALLEETHPELKPYAAILKADVAAADAAIASQTAADEENRRFREIGALAQYLDALEATRDKVYATLEQRRAEHPEWKVDRSWASDFFPRLTPAPTTEEERKAREAERAAARKARDDQKQKERAAQDKVRQAQKELQAVKKGG